MGLSTCLVTAISAFWVALLAAVFLGLNTFGMLGRCKEIAESQGAEMAVLAVASVVLLLQAVFDGLWERVVALSWEWFLAVICGGLSLLTTLGAWTGAAASTEQTWRLLSAALMFLWLCAVVVLTFDRPYTFVGNAFFACWAGFGASAALMCKHFPELKGRNLTDSGGHVVSPTPAAIGACTPSGCA